MGAVLCCCSDPVNFDGEVDLYHFDLHRAVGKGAFGKVGGHAQLCPDSCVSNSQTGPGSRA